MSREYDALLDRLAHLEPRFGWTHTSQFPELTEAELAAVLEREPDLWMDAFDEADRRTQRRMTAALASPQLTGRQQLADIGALLLEAVTPLARRYLLRELQERAERFDEDAAKERAHERAAREAAIPRSGPI